MDTVLLYNYTETNCLYGKTGSILSYSKTVPVKVVKLCPTSLLYKQKPLLQHVVQIIIVVYNTPLIFI